MDRRQFLSLSAVAWLRAARANPAITAVDMQQAPDFDIAFITDVHIERGKIAVSKFSETISEINMQMPHHFGLSIDTMELDIGKHRIVAKVTWPDGTIVIESADFTVTNKETSI